MPEAVSPRRRLAFASFALGIPTLAAVLRATAQPHAVGHYRLGWFLADWAALVGIVAVALGCNWALRRIIEGWLRPKRWPSRIALGLARAAILLLVPGTFAFAVLQLRPAHVLPWATPAEYGLAYEDVAIEADGLRLVGWYIPGRDEASPVVVVAHGVGGSRADGLAGAMVAHRIGYASLLLDHPGHGESDGAGATYGLREARGLQAAHDWLKARDPARPVHAIGYSMGGSAVLHAAAEYGIFERVVVDSTFGRLERAAKQSRLFALGPAAGVAWNLLRLWGLLLSGEDLSRVAPEDDLARLARPVLVIHGAQDRLVPLSEAESLEAYGRGLARLFVVPGANHMQTIGDPDYARQVGEFLQGRLPALAAEMAVPRR